MKKLFLILIIAAFAFQMQAQRLNNERENILIYSDTTVLNGGDTLTRLLYGFLPMDRGNDNYVYEYRKIYKLNSEVILVAPMVYNATPQDSVLLFGQYRTFGWVYPQVVDINETNWQTAAWQTYLQKLHNQ